MDFTRLVICILQRSALRLLMGKSSILTELSARNTSIFYFQDNNLCKSQWSFTKFGVCIDIMKSCLWIAHGQISSMSDRVICPRHDNGGVLSFHVLFIHRMPCAITQQCVYGLGFKQMRKLFVCKRFFCLFVLCFCCFFFFSCCRSCVFYCCFCVYFEIVFEILNPSQSLTGNWTNRKS